MPNYMVQWRYESSAVKGMVDKPEDREESIKPVIEAFGGELLGYYFCFGDYDGMALLDMPDNEAIAALIVNTFKEGALSNIKTTVLFTSNESVQIMERAAIQSGYVAPNE